MPRGPILAAVLILAPAMAAAAPPPAKTALPGTTSALAPKPQPQGLKRITLSPEGRAIAARIIGTADPRSTQIQTDMAAVRKQKLDLIGGQTIDVDKLEPLLRKEEALQSEFRTRQNDRLLVLLRALPDSDRIALLHSMTNPAKPDGAKAPVPATPAN